MTELKTVIDNDAPEGRQCLLERRIQVAFADAAASLLRFICCEPDDGIIDKLSDFVDLYVSSMDESTDPKGLAIRIPSMKRKGIDKIINTLLRGALLMSAARLQIHATMPNGEIGDSYRKFPSYEKALDELSRGVDMLNDYIARHE